MNGKYIIIKLGSTPIAALKAVSIQTSAKKSELSNAGISASENMWERSIVTSLEWSISTDQLVASNAEAAASLLRAGKTYTINVYGSAADNAPILQGRAICTKASVKSAVGSLIKGAFSFDGTGPLE